MKIKHWILAASVSACLSACGGGSGDSAGANNQPVDADTGQLKSTAVNSLGGNFEDNLSALGKMFNQNSDVLVGTVGDVVVGGTTKLPTELDTDTQVQSPVQSLVNSSLATGDTGNSTTTRNGNSITVDPDENELCRDESLFDVASGEVAQCAALLKDLTVELLATSEQDGVLTYLYKQQPVLRLGYGINSESVELDLGGLKTLISEAAIISTGEALEDLPSTMVGSVKLSTVSSNTSPGAEAGSISIDIVKPIEFVSANDEGSTSLSLSPGALFTVSADAATGQGSLTFDVGAIAAAAPTDTGLGRFNLAGFTGSADLNPANGTLVVRNLGLSKGPMSASINNQEIMKMTLGAFGFHVTADTDMVPGELVVDGDMDLSLALSQFGEFELNDNLASAALRLMVPASTSIARAGNGTTRIGGAGPLSVSVRSTDANNVESVQTLTVNSGECFGSVDVNGDTLEPSAEQCL